MINWKVRLKNKTFLASMIALIVGFVYDLLGLLGVAPTVEQSAVMAAASAILQILGMIGVIADPTTAGLGDSKRALGYEEPYKDEE